MGAGGTTERAPPFRFMGAHSSAALGVAFESRSNPDDFRAIATMKWDATPVGVGPKDRRIPKGFRNKAQSGPFRRATLGIRPRTHAPTRKGLHKGGLISYANVHHPVPSPYPTPLALIDRDATVPRVVRGCERPFVKEIPSGFTRYHPAPHIDLPSSLRPRGIPWSQDDFEGISASRRRFRFSIQSGAEQRTP